MYNIPCQKLTHNIPFFSNFINPMSDDYFVQNGSFFPKVNHNHQIPEENFIETKKEDQERKIILKQEPSNDENTSIYKEFFF